MTTTAVRWVLVEGTTGEGAPVDRGSLPIEATLDADALLDGLLGTETSCGLPSPRGGRHLGP